MRFRVLGELEVLDGDAVVPIPGRKPRALLALLLLHAGQTLSTDRLCEDLWDGDPPTEAAKSLQMHVTRLRRAMTVGPDGPLATRPGGYLLDVGPGELDLPRFEALLADGCAALEREDPTGARPVLAEALGLWRGAPLEEFRGEAWAQRQIARLEELHVQALEARIRADLLLGRHDALVPELQDVTARWPLRESLREAQMLALYGCGRQSEALAVFHAARRMLGDELGLEPGPALRRTHEAILAHDPTLERPAPAAAPAAPLPPRLARARLPDFVGRREEHARLEAELATARAGEHRAVLVAGEPGIGKTRLAAEFAARAHASGATILDGRCDEDLLRPYAPVVEALDQLVAQAPGRVLREHVEAWGGELGRLAPRLHDRVPGAPGPRAVGSETERYLLFGAVGGLLAAACAARPVVLVVDDLHWADRPTLLLLRHVLQSPTPTRLLVVGTYRSTEVGADHPLAALLADLEREARATRIELAGLAEAEIEELVAGVRDPALGPPEPGFSARLRLQTGGNPFFVSEIVRSLSAAGGEASGSADPPTSVQDMIVRRVTRLGDGARTVLTSASALGQDFDMDTLGQVLGGDEAALVEVLDAAVEAMLLRPAPDVPGRFSFVHALIDQALYRELGPAHRCALHRRIATALEQLDGEERVTELAHHWALGAGPREIDKPLEYARRAGDRALRMLAPDEALRWYRQALELHERAPGTDSARHCELLISRGQAERQSGDPAFRNTLLAAADIAQREGDDDRLVRAALANTRGFSWIPGTLDRQRAAVLHAAIDALGTREGADGSRLRATLAAELAFDPDPDPRRRLSDEALAMARRIGDDRALSYALSTRFVSIWAPHTLEERSRVSEEAVAVATRHGDPSILASALHWRLCVLLEQGDVAQAGRVSERQLALARELRRPTVLWLATFDSANLATVRGHLEEAEALAGQATSAHPGEAGRGDALPFYVNQLCNIRFEQGRLDELTEPIVQAVAASPRIPGLRALLALAHCEGGAHDTAREILVAEDLAALPVDVSWLAALAVYAHVAARVEEPESARRLYDSLVPWHEQTIFTGSSSFGCVGMYLGMLATVLEDFDAAEAHLADALTRHERAGAPMWIARTRMQTAEMLVRRDGAGDAERGRSALEQTLRYAIGVGCPPVRLRAEALLAGVSAGPARVPPSPGRS